MVKENPTFSEKEFLYRLTRGDYEKEWAKIRKPGFGDMILPFLFRLVPKFGLLESAGLQAFKVPTRERGSLHQECG